MVEYYLFLEGVGAGPTVNDRELGLTVTMQTFNYFARATDANGNVICEVPADEFDDDNRRLLDPLLDAYVEAIKDGQDREIMLKFKYPEGYAFPPRGVYTVSENTSPLCDRTIGGNPVYPLFDFNDPSAVAKFKEAFNASIEAKGLKKVEETQN